MPNEISIKLSPLVMFCALIEIPETTRVKVMKYDFKIFISKQEK